MHQITYFSIYIDYENRHLTSFHFANISSIKSGYNLLKKFQRWNTKGKDDINCLHTRFHNEKVYKSSPLLNRAIIKFKTFWQRHVNLSFSFFIVVTMNNNLHRIHPFLKGILISNFRFAFAYYHFSHISYIWESSCWLFLLSQYFEDKSIKNLYTASFLLTWYSLINLEH